MLTDLRSDTVTKPSEGMLERMMSAKTGDDVFGEDPTVIELEKKLADIFGMDAGIFAPSGTMTNQIAIRMHTVPGQEVICHKESHVYKYEGAGIMVNSHCSVKLLDGNRGRLVKEDVESSLNNPEDVHLPVSRLVCLEDTANRGGGAVYDPAEINRISEFCRKAGLKIHLDGARVFNALAVNSTDARSYGKNFDSISVCLSKSLGTPSGSVLLGSRDDIYRARRIRKVLGGGMRQVGILAAAGLYALENNIGRLHDDHRRAGEIGKMLQDLPQVTEVFPVETNIVVARLNESTTVDLFVSQLKAENILAVPFGPGLVRMVTHLDITDDNMDHLRSVLKKF